MAVPQVSSYTYISIPTLTPLDSFSCFAADSSSGVQEGEAGDDEEAEELAMDEEAKGQSKGGWADTHRHSTIASAWKRLVYCARPSPPPGTYTEDDAERTSAERARLGSTRCCLFLNKETRCQVHV